MGVDVNLYAVGNITDEELDHANGYMRDRGIHGFGPGDPPLVRGRFVEDGRVEWSTLTRYYGPGYERGPWPWIYGAIVCLRAAFPDADIYYGGDTTDDGQLVTDELLDEVWAHWLGPDGDAYRRHSRALNAQLRARRP